MAGRWMLVVGGIPQSSLLEMLEYTPNVAAGLSRVSQEKESHVEVVSFYDLALEVTLHHSCCHLLYFAMESLDAAYDQQQENKDPALFSSSTLPSPTRASHWLHRKARRAREPVILSASWDTEVGEKGESPLGRTNGTSH